MASATYNITYNYEYITDQSSLARVMEWMRNHKSFAVDLETTGLDPFTDDIILMQIGNIDKQWIVDVRVVNIEPLRPIMEDPHYIKLGQNIKFDLKFLQFKYGWRFENVADTMVAEQVMRCGILAGKGSASMAGLVKFYLGMDIDKDHDLRTGFGQTAVNAFSERQLRYAAGDCIFPVYVARHQKAKIRERGLVNTLSLEHAFIPVLASMELEGMRMDTDAWTALYQQALRSAAEYERRLDKLFQVEKVSQGDMFGDSQLVRSVNYGSWQQVLKAFYRMGYRTLQSTDSEDVALAAIRGEIPRELAQALIAYRIYRKRANTYGLGFLEAVHPVTGHIHSDFTQTRTHTGRLSSGQQGFSTGTSKRVNLQNIPRLKSYRNCFIPDEGDVFIVWDLKAIEPRILGDMSQDPTYVDTFMNNGDIYNALGTTIYGETVSKAPGKPSELRTKTKIGILGTSYGTGKAKFHRKMLLDLNLTEEGFLKDEEVQITSDESDALWEGIFEACPVIRETLNGFSEVANPLGTNRTIYDERAAHEPENKVREKLEEMLSRNDKLSEAEIKDKARRLARKRGYVSYSASVNGRKRYFKIYHSSSYTEGRNHPIQGTAADILKKASVDVHRRILQEGHDAAIINQVHDELILRCSKDHAEAVNEYTRELMEEAGNAFMKTIPCIAEGGIVSKWEKD